MQHTLTCVTPAVVVSDPRGGPNPRTAGYLTLSTYPARLGGGVGLSLGVGIGYAVVPRPVGAKTWEAEVSSYSYPFLLPDLRESFAYHWHPHVAEVAYPHLHLGPAAVQSGVLERAGLSALANALRSDVAGAHFPTGPVALETVLWLAITQFGAEPLRPDWRRLLPAPGSGSFTTPSTPLS